MKLKYKPNAKHEALEASGCVNARAQAVHDSSFEKGGFFDSHDLVQVRYEMLRRVSVEGLSITDAVERFGVTRPTFYKVQSDFARAGLAGLLPAKRGPHGPHKITDEVMRFIEQARMEEPQLDGPTLVERVQRHFGVVLHRRTVERFLVASKKKHH